MMDAQADLTSLDVDSESPEIVSENPEIISVPSCSSSLSASQDNPETLGSLLLQIQHFHTAEMQKLHEKANKWKTKCIKLAKVANNNADSAKNYFKHNKILVIKMAELTEQLKAFQNQSHLVGIRSEITTQAHPPIKEPLGAELSNKPGNQDKGVKNKVLQNEAVSKVSSKPPSKLTSKKSRKKVRYSEISPDETLKKQPCEMTANINPEMAKIRPLDRQNCQKSTPQVPRILAPDTCPSPTIPSPSCKMNPSPGTTPSGHGKTNPSPAGREPWIPKTGNALTIPETIDLTYEDLCAPAYESTPVLAKQNISSDLESSKNLRENRFIQDLSVKKLFPETPVGQKLLVTSMPRSESQYPVDLFHSQVKSPTFCGESVMTTPGSRVTVQKNKPPPLRGDNSDTCAWDETCESEDSILLLGRIEKVSVTEAGDSEVASRSKSNQENQTEETTTSLSVKGQNETTPAKDLRMSNLKKRRYSPGDSSNSFGEETVLSNAAALGKENSPEGLDDLNYPNINNGVMQIEKEVNCLEKIAAPREKVIRQKSLKQSKLSQSMFKPGVTRPLSLMQKYNGGNAAFKHVDSQFDQYLNQGIELSLVEQKGPVRMEETNKSSFKRRRVEAAVSVSGDASEGFKIPNIPHQKRQMQVGSPTPNTENRQHLPHSSDFTSTPRDLNGSIDPLMDLTRLESDGASSPGEMDLGRQEEHPRSCRGDSPGQEADFGSHVGDEGNDSCADLFQEDEDDEDEEEVDEEQEEVDEEEVDEEEVDVEEVDEEEMNECVEEEVDRSVDRQEITGYISNFDKVPKKNEQPNYKYTEVVRKRDERQKLKGFGCKECDQFYGNLELTDAEREVRMKECSRHRAVYIPPNTPEHYWSIGFPDTQTCIERGYINAGGSPDRQVRKKKNKYKLKKILGKEAKEDVNEMDG